MAKWNPKFPFDYSPRGGTIDDLGASYVDEINRIYTLLNQLRENAEGTDEPQAHQIMINENGNIYIRNTQNSGWVMVGKVAENFGLEQLGFVRKEEIGFNEETGVLDVNISGNAGKVAGKSITTEALEDGEVLVYRASVGGFVNEPKSAGTGAGKSLAIYHNGELHVEYNGSIFKDVQFIQYTKDEPDGISVTKPLIWLKANEKENNIAGIYILSQDGYKLLNVPLESVTESQGTITVKNSDGNENTIDVVTSINGNKGAITNIFDTTTEQTVDVKKIFRQLYLKNTDNQNEGGELSFIYSKDTKKWTGIDLFHTDSQNPAMRFIDYGIMTDSTRTPFYFYLDGNIKTLLGDADFIKAKAFGSASSYVKYASGKQEVWMRGTSTGNDTTVTLPVSFKTAVCIVSPWGSSSNVFGAKFVDTNKVQVYVPQGLGYGLYVVGEAS